MRYRYTCWIKREAEAEACEDLEARRALLAQGSWRKADAQTTRRVNSTSLEVATSESGHAVEPMQRSIVYGVAIRAAIPSHSEANSTFCFEAKLST